MLKPKTYSVLSMAVENGIKYGLNRSFKHTDDPTHEQMEAAIYDAVMNEILEWFDMEGQNAESNLDDR